MLLGTGKTLLAQTLADLIGVPMVIADATSLTQVNIVVDNCSTAQIIVDCMLLALYCNVRVISRRAMWEKMWNPFWHSCMLVPITICLLQSEVLYTSMR